MYELIKLADRKVLGRFTREKKELESLCAELQQKLHTQSELCKKKEEVISTLQKRIRTLEGTASCVDSVPTTTQTKMIIDFSKALIEPLAKVVLDLNSARQDVELYKRVGIKLKIRYQTLLKQYNTLLERTQSETTEEQSCEDKTKGECCESKTEEIERSAISLPSGGGAQRHPYAVGRESVQPLDVLPRTNGEDRKSLQIKYEILRRIYDATRKVTAYASRRFSLEKQELQRLCDELKHDLHNRDKQVSELLKTTNSLKDRIRVLESTGVCACQSTR